MARRTSGGPGSPADGQPPSRMVGQRAPTVTGMTTTPVPPTPAGPRAPFPAGSPGRGSAASPPGPPWPAPSLGHPAATGRRRLRGAPADRPARAPRRAGGRLPPPVAPVGAPAGGRTSGGERSGAAVPRAAGETPGRHEVPPGTAVDAREDDRSVGLAAREDDLQAGAGGMDVQETDAGTGLAGVAGLTSREAEARRRRGEGNVAVSASSRSYARILRTNVFSFYNVILFVIGAALLALGRYNDAFTSVGLGLVKAAISAVQEIRAKRKLDRLQLLSRSPVTVLRDGRETSVAQEDVVRGDVLCVRPGDQVVVDGPVLDGGRVEVDESLLTGESEPQLREPGEDLLSGSLCVGGGGHQLARDVGASSYASRLTAEARQASTDTTPLQRRIQFVVRLVMVLVALMSAAILLQAALEGFSLVRVVQTTAVREEVPFSSSLRWSALRTDDGAVVLGAPDALAPALSGAPLTDAVAALTGRGLRVLVVARAADPAARLRDDTGRPRLPALEPLAVVALADELRPDVSGTLAGLIAGGTAVKVVSGDDPRTVAALARQAGLDGGQPVTGADLDALSDREFDDVVARTTVFGRIAPEQKERLVASLRRQGRYVAMVGDGVNDARALKRAHVGVAMRSGSAVTRDVADIVLTDDSLTALLPAQHEGRRIVNGITTSMYVFLARVVSQGLVILTVTMLGLGFPYSPANVGLTLLTVGLPTLFLTMWARPAPPDPHLLTSLWRFLGPALVVTP